MVEFECMSGTLDPSTNSTVAVSVSGGGKMTNAIHQAVINPPAPTPGNWQPDMPWGEDAHGHHQEQG